jgi:hypothetical protein
MSLTPILRSVGSDAYVLRDEENNEILVYDRRARTIDVIPDPGVLAGRGTWLTFDGDSRTIVSEVEKIRKG